MTIPIPGEASNASAVASQLEVKFVELYNNLTAWRQRIADNSATDSLDAQVNYTLVTSTRAFIAERVTKNAGGVAEEYIRNYPSHQDGEFDIATEWPPLKAALDDFVTFFKGLWPKKVPTTGEWAFMRTRADEQLESFPVPVTGTPKTNFLAKLDAITVLFTPI